MMIGFGSLKQMNDTLRANRAALKRTKSVREVYKQEIRKISASIEHQDIEHVRARVVARVKRNRVREILERTAAAIFALLLIALIAWIVTVNFFNDPFNRKQNTKALFKTIVYDMGNGITLQTDYYRFGPKAAETYFTKNLKHLSSESFYPSGEPFRSALYYYDTLVKEVFLYRTGDTIKNFPIVDPKSIVQITLADSTSNTRIEFLMYDHKILNNSYQELDDLN